MSETVYEAFRYTGSGSDQDVGSSEGYVYPGHDIAFVEGGQVGLLEGVVRQSKPTRVSITNFIREADEIIEVEVLRGGELNRLSESEFREFSGPVPVQGATLVFGSSRVELDVHLTGCQLVFEEGSVGESILEKFAEVVYI